MVYNHGVGLEARKAKKDHPIKLRQHGNNVNKLGL
jgi:hypothetical protein